MPLPRRTWILALVAVLLASAVLLPLHPVSATGGVLQPPFADRGLDTDADGLYDWLVIDVDIQVTAAGPYDLHGVTSSSPFLSADNTTYLEVGLRALPLWIPGWLIYRGGLDGPYNFTVTLVDYTTGATLDETTYETAAYAYGAFEPPKVTLAPPVTVTPVDLNGNGLYDELRFELTANVTQDGTYRLHASLLARTPVYWASLATLPEERTLARGSHRLTFVFAGGILREAGWDGPYMAGFDYLESTGTYWMTASQVTVTTTLYLANQFDLLWIRFGSPISDETRDTDGDGLRNEIVVHVPLVAEREVNLTVQAYLQAGTIGVSAVLPGLHVVPPGPGRIDLVFETFALQEAHRDGPYSVFIALAVDALGWRGPSILHTTQTYYAVTFDPPSASPDMAGAASRVTDADGDGKADLLAIDVPVVVREEGNYSVWGYLTNTPGIHQGFLHLSAGNGTVTLTFSGIALNRSFADGPWELQMAIMRLDGSMNDRSSAMWTTPAYRRQDFEGRPMASFDLSVIGNGGWGVGWSELYLADPTTRFWWSNTTDAWGYARIPAYEGTFLLGVKPGLTHYQPTVVRITVQDGGRRNLTLAGPAEDAVRWALDLRSWNETIVTATRTLVHGASIHRLLADRYGNLDGTANASELSLYVANEGWGVFEPSPEQFPIGIDVDRFNETFRSSVFVEAKGEGDVLLTAPVNGTWTHHYANTTANGTGRGHNVTLRIPYDVPGLNGSAKIRLPANATGNLSASANVTVVRLSPGAWDVDAGGAPADSGLRYAEVRIEALAAGSTGTGPPPPADGWILPLALGAGAGGAVAVLTVVWWFRRSRAGTARRDKREDSP